MHKSIQDILGLRVLAIRGRKPRKNAASVPPQYILFDDGKTYIYLEEQDYYSYHDCALSARHIQVNSDVDQWEYVYTSEDYMGSTEDI